MIVHQPRARWAHGFSMIELLCSVALSLVLVTGVVATLLSSSASYESAEYASRLEERGWLALDILGRDIRNAAFAGCTRSPRFEGSSLANAEVLWWNFLDGGIKGYDANDIATVPGDKDIPGAAQESDVLVVQVPKRGAEPLQLRTDMNGPNDHLTVTGPTAGLAEGDIALIYNCQARAYFHVSSLSHGTITHTAGSGVEAPSNADSSLGYTFQAGAEIIPVQTIVYYIRADSPDRIETRSLWRRVGLAEPEELIEGVEQMQLQFGIDMTGDSVIDAYVTAEAVENWRHVYSVSVALLVRSGQETTAQQKPHQMLDVTVVSSDTYVKQVFSRTTTIRNRAPAY